MSLTIGLQLVTDAGNRFAWTSNLYVAPRRETGLDKVIGKIKNIWRTWGLFYLPG